MESQSTQNNNSHPINALNTILSGMISESSGKIDRTDVMDLLFSYCNNNDIESDIRIDVLDLVEKVLNSDIRIQQYLLLSL